MPAPEPATGGTVVHRLAQARASDQRTNGAKAANLSAASVAGLPVLPGFVLVDAAAAEVARSDGAGSDAVNDALAAWRELSDDGALPVVVRSSSTDEDGAESSNAGRFCSILDVTTAEGFIEAVHEVVRSANVVSMASPHASRMAVLVQRQVHPVRSGVAFGADPVSGRLDRRVIVAVNGRPEALVGGEVSGERTIVSRTGRVVSRSHDGTAVLDRRARRAVLRLGRRAAELFGAPQDIEWAIDADGRLWLLQSRPITALGAVGRGPVFGTGPVAETFPSRLRPLEVALWVEPLRFGLVEALALTSAAPARRIRSSPVVTSVDGWVAVDLDLVAPARRRGLAKIDPRPSLRHLGAAWRIGRLRAALPALISDLVASVDRELAALPELSTLGGEQLLGIVERSRQVLVALQGHEVLAGTLHGHGDELTAASLALRELAAREPGESDAEVVARAPVVLTLLPPSIAQPSALPATVDAVPTSGHADVAMLGPREALRLRARWVQELMAVLIREIASRHPAEGVELDLADVALFDLDEVRAWCRTSAVPDDLVARRLAGTLPRLPVSFRFADDGSVVATPRARGDEGGEAAGGGRAIGVVASTTNPTPGAILVVPTLDPRLAPLLPGLSGLVAETGSPLSHLAILAREHNVATVVGVVDACRRFPVGSTVLVDGSSGEVALVESDEAVAR